MIYNTVPAHLQSNKVAIDDSPGHDWYRFVLSYPPHIVRHYFEKFNIVEGMTVLDPFCGTGTTLLEAKKFGVNAFGVEANPVARLASMTKLNWNVDENLLYRSAKRIASELEQEFAKIGIKDESVEFSGINELLLETLPLESYKLLLKGSINPVSLHKSLNLIKKIKRTRVEIRDHLLVAAVTTIVNDVSNLRFGPEVGVTKIKSDKPLIRPWLERVSQISHDLELFKNSNSNNNSLSKVVKGDARLIDHYFDEDEIDCIITSPPYPNEKDYSRTTRLENVLLGYISNMKEQRVVKKTFVRSNTRSVYVSDRDHEYVKDIDSIQKIAHRIEARRIELGKTSGFEKLYPKVTLQYFGGMMKHLIGCKKTLKPGSKLAYVVGDQGSYLRVMIRTGHLLAEIAEKLGYQVEDIELFRTRFATVSKQELREEVLILSYNG